MEIWEKLKNRNIIWFSDSTFGCISKGNKERSLKSYSKQSQPVRERQISYDITYMWNLKYGKDELIYKTETDSHFENKLCLPNVKGRDKLGIWD